MTVPRRIPHIWMPPWCTNPVRVLLSSFRMNESYNSAFYLVASGWMNHTMNGSNTTVYLQFHITPLGWSRYCCQQCRIADRILNSNLHMAHTCQVHTPGSSEPNKPGSILPITLDRILLPMTRPCLTKDVSQAATQHEVQLSDIPIFPRFPI